MIFAALASIFLGAVAAFGQTNIKRLLAYSSINNVGFVLIGVAGAGAVGASSVLFYMAVYVPMTLGAFLCVLWMRDKDGEPVEDIYSLSGLSQTRPAFAAAIAVFMDWLPQARRGPDLSIGAAAGHGLPQPAADQNSSVRAAS